MLCFLRFVPVKRRGLACVLLNGVVPLRVLLTAAGVCETSSLPTSVGVLRVKEAP